MVFLNRSPNQHKNGTWFHLYVHAPPRFSVTPEDIIYVNLGKLSFFFYDLNIYYICYCEYYIKTHMLVIFISIKRSVSFSYHF